MEENNQNESREGIVSTIAIIFIIASLVFAIYALSKINGKIDDDDKEVSKSSTEATVGLYEPDDSDPDIEITEEDSSSPEATIEKESEEAAEEKPEPKISDYFVKTGIIVEGNESQYSLSDDSEMLVNLISDYNYFDLQGFFMEYVGDTKLCFMRAAGNNSLRLSSEQSPFNTPTTVIRNDIETVLRVIKDENNEVRTTEDDYDYYIDIRTIMDNEANLGTYIYVCNKGTCYMGKYIGHAIPSDIMFNVSRYNDGYSSDRSTSFFSIIEKDALRSLLKMAEAGVLFTDENPFEAIGDDWEEIEDYKLFMDQPENSDGSNESIEGFSNEIGTDDVNEPEDSDGSGESTDHSNDLQG